MINRRKFLYQTAVSAGALLLPTHLLRGQDIESANVASLFTSMDGAANKKLADFALQLAKSNNATYADVRIVSTLQEQIIAIDKTTPQIRHTYSKGFSVRVVVAGCMCFVAEEGVPTTAALEKLVGKSIEMAKSTAALKINSVKMAPQEALHQVSWKTPVVKDVLEVSLQEKQQLLTEVNQIALSNGADYVESMLFVQREQTYLATTDGSYIQQEIHQFWPTFVVQAGQVGEGNCQRRKALSTPVGKGYEYLQKAPTDKVAGKVVRYKSSYDILEDVKSAAQQVKQLQTAKSVESGQYDLVVDPSALAGVIHHTIGKALNMDFIAGDEVMNGASSFIDLTKWKAGEKTLGSRYISFLADRQQAGALGNVGYDDEGIKAKQWPLVKDGVLESFFTDRTKNQLIDENRSSGCGRAEGWQTPMRCHMPNISLAPGKSPLTVDELISEVKKGIWIVGEGDFSTDQQFLNFQSTGYLCYEIENGEIKGLLKDVAFQSTTKDFWNACIQICDRRDYRIAGTLTTQIGSEVQRLAASHGSTTSRFNGIQVVNTKSK